MSNPEATPLAIPAPMVERAHRLIASDARIAWRKANTRPNGRRYKRHRPYSLPDRAAALVEALGSGDPERVSAIMLYRY